jgi:uncharacterized membrane protein
MNTPLPSLLLAAIVAVILLAARTPRLALLFRWAPVPLWCYAIPMAAGSLGWLPQDARAWRALIDTLLPFALALLLLGVNIGGLRRIGGRLLTAGIAGALGVVLGAVLGVRLLSGHLPADAWKGAGTLAATWTGGTMNMLAARALLDVPDAVFAPLVVVDACTAYGWMAILVAVSGAQAAVNRWLKADGAVWELEPPEGSRGSLAAGVGLSAALAAAALWLSPRLPVTGWIGSASAWAVLLLTTSALALSAWPAVRQLGRSTDTIGYPCLYLVLAATGAQARPDALIETPAWLLVGAMVVVVHGVFLVSAGRLFRIPVGVLATASQANIGGVVSAPLVGAVYHRSLAPAGLVLALAGNALGTYIGWLAAAACRGITGGS